MKYGIFLAAAACLLSAAASALRAQDAPQWSPLESTARRTLLEEGMPPGPAQLDKPKTSLDDAPFPVRDTPGPIALLGPETFLGAPGDYAFVYALQYNLKEMVAGQNARLGYGRQDFEGAVPIIDHGKDLTLAATLNLRWLDFNTNAIFPTSKRPFPGDIYNVEPGLFYRQKFENGIGLGGYISLGSPSDQPYHSGRELAPAVNGFISLPRDNGDAYLLSFFYQPTGEIRFPVPGFAYQYNGSDDLQVNIGLPFDLRWRFAEHWRLEAGYVPIRLVKATVYYDFLPQNRASLYAGFEWNNDSYLLADRPAYNQYFFEYEKRVQLGLRVNWTKNFTTDAVAGYGFDRYFFLGKNYTHRNDDRVNMGDGAFFLLRAGLKF